MPPAAWLLPELEMPLESGESAGMLIFGKQNAKCSSELIQRDYIDWSSHL